MPLSRRKRIVVITIAAVLGVVGLGVGGSYAVSVVRHGGGSTAHATASSDSGRLTGAEGPGHAYQPGLSDSASAGPAPTASPTPTPTRRRTPSTGRTTKAPTKQPSASAPSSATAAPAQRPPSVQAAVQGVFAQLNQLRTANGVPALALSDGLLASTHAHNLLMVNGCGLSHQCPGEASLGDRVSAQGVSWTTLGENISAGGKVDNSDAAITEAAEGQTTGMFNEKAPDDGHRQNILNPAYGHVGVDVVIDADGTVWMTQDFAS